MIARLLCVMGFHRLARYAVPTGFHFACIRCDWKRGDHVLT